MKRSDTPTTTLDKRLYYGRLPGRGHTAGADNWNSGFADIDWIKRHSLDDDIELTT